MSFYYNKLNKIKIKLAKKKGAESDRCFVAFTVKGVTGSSSALVH